jgi:hypothetical protein
MATVDKHPGSSFRLNHTHNTMYTKSVPITIAVVSSNLEQGEVYNIIW